MNEFLAIPVITGVVQALKVAFLPGKFAGLVSIVLGILFSVGVNRVFSVETVLMGITFGLSASGIYDGVKQGVEPTRTLIGKMVK